MRSRKQQHGAFLVLAAILIVVLLGITALAIDIGRLVSMRAEMQNAVDAAALAAAAELNSNPGAQARAEAAARDLLQHDSRFAQVAALLGDAQLPTGPKGAFTFYCIIGSSYDPPSSAEISNYCSGSKDAQGFYPAGTNDAQSHYVSVALDPALITGGSKFFRMQLYMLPTLSAIGMSPASAVTVRAAATGGRNVYTCAIAPIGICDPWEGSGTTFSQAMVIGQAIQIRSKGSLQWSNGNFGFLTPPSGGSGAKVISQYLANESNAGCSSPNITTQPGGMTQKTTDAINTRFDQYGSGFNSATDPSAPNVVNYPNDASAQTIDSRFGNGDWDFNTYWSGAHPGVSAPNAWSNASRPSRWSVYNWELANKDSKGKAMIPNVSPSYLGVPNAKDTVGSLTRRLISVAVMSCTAMGLQGRASGTIFPPDGYAQIFLYRQADGPPNTAAYGEYVGWDQTGGSSNYNAQPLLYQ